MKRRDQTSPRTSAQRRREAIANEYLDAVVEGRTDDARRILDSSGERPLVREEIRALRDVILELRTPIRGPDLSAAILRQMHAQRPFVEAPLRRRISRSRLLMVAAALALCVSAAMMHRLSPTDSAFTVAEGGLESAPSRTTWDRPATPTMADVSPTGRMAIAAPDDGPGPHFQVVTGLSPARLWLGDTRRFEQTRYLDGAVRWVSAGSGESFPAVPPAWRAEAWEAVPVDVALFPAPRPSLLRTSPTTASYARQKWAPEATMLPPTEHEVEDGSPPLTPDDGDAQPKSPAPAPR